MKILTISVAVIILGGFGNTTDVDSAFKKAKLIPQIINDQSLELLEVSYGDTNVTLGNDLTQIDTTSMPTFNYNYQPGEYYTLIMTDPDVPTPSFSLPGEFFLWVVGNIPGNKTSSGEVVITYFPPLPPPETEIHRFTFLLYRQPSLLTFTDDYILGINLINRMFSSAKAFASKHNLGNPIAGNFFFKEFDFSIVQKWLSLFSYNQ